MRHFLLAVAIASSYVASIYVYQPEHIRVKDRNDPEVIWHRFSRVTLLCGFWIAFVPFILSQWDPRIGYGEILQSFGLIPGLGPPGTSLASDLNNSAWSAVAILVLYTGVVVDYFYQKPSARDMVESVTESFFTLEGFRNHVFAPVTEELIYRALIIKVLVYGRVNETERALWWTPLLFGIAHVHHAVVLARTTKLPVTMVIVNGVFQTVYTTVFGVIANHFYIQSQTLASPVVVHTICNVIGIPPSSVEGPPIYRGAYYGLLGLGVLMFGRLIGFY